jgi:hypothetical protein
VTDEERAQARQIIGTRQLIMGAIVKAAARHQSRQWPLARRLWRFLAAYSVEVLAHLRGGFRPALDGDAGCEEQFQR